MYLFRRFLLILISPFSRLANKISWRAGRPYRSRFEQVRPYIGLIEPGMVILCHKEYELTNWFISGYWTHVAVMARENTIIEAVSRGVIRTPAEVFFSSIDDFIVLEPAFCMPSERLKAVEYMEQFIGYPYNFAFMPRDDAFTCIDLVCRAYGLPARKGKAGKIHPLDLIGYFSTDVILPENLLDASDSWRVVTQAAGMTA